MPTIDRTLRRRRLTDPSGIPKDLRRWFLGEIPRPWDALLSPHYERLQEYWHAFVAENPAAKPPAGYERLAGGS